MKLDDSNETYFEQLMTLPKAKDVLLPGRNWPGIDIAIEGQGGRGGGEGNCRMSEPIES